MDGIFPGTRMKELITINNKNNKYKNLRVYHLAGNTNDQKDYFV